MKSFKMEPFKLALGAALVLMSMPSRAAQPVTFRSNSSKISYYQPSRGLNTKGLPRSTVAIITPAATGRPTSGHSELDRLEHQATSQLQAESRHQARPANTAAHFGRSPSSSHGSTINFSYHGPRNQMSKSAASGSRRR